MSVSEKEEHVAQRHSSDTVAGIPIKKRRFPALFSTSESSLESAVNDLPKKDLSKTLRESSITDNVGLLTSSSNISFAKENAKADASREPQNISDLPSVRIEGPICVSSDSIVVKEMKMKNFGAEKIDFQKDFGYTEPCLVKKESVSLYKGEGGHIASKHKLEGNSELELSAFAEGTKLFGRPMEHHFQALAGENIRKTHQIQEQLDHVSLNLSLSKGNNIVKCQSYNVEPKRSDIDMSANINKWDLNTTMDNWEDSETDTVAWEGAVADTSFGGTVFDEGTFDITSGKGDSVASLESRGSTSSKLPSQQCTPDNSLNLCLSPSYQELTPCQKNIKSPLGFNTSRMFSSTNTPAPAVVPSTPSLIHFDKSSVKSEPVEESTVRVLSENENSKLSFDENSLRNETTDISIKLGNSCSQPVLVSGSIKSELLEDTNKGTAEVGVKSYILQKHSELSITEEKLPPSCASSKMVADSGFTLNSSELLKGVCSEEAPQEASEKVQLNDSVMTNTRVAQEVDEIEVLDGMAETKGSSDVTVDSSNEPGEIILLGKHGNGDGSESVQEPSTYSDATITSQVATVTVSQSEEESTKVTNLVEKNIVALHKMENSTSGTDEPKNGISPGNRSRIINLKAVNISSATGKTRSIPGMGTSSRTGREKYANSGMEGDMFYHPRGRERGYNESHHRFSRDGNNDQPYRNFRMNYSRGRGRGSSWPRTNYVDSNEDCDIPEQGYSTRFHISRPRHRGSDDADDAKHDSECYVPGFDRMAGPGRGRRRPISDEEIPKFRDFSSRGRSFVPHRQIVRRPTRTFSSHSKCIGEDGSTDIVGLRASDKFTRAMDDSMVDPVFTRPKPYDASDRHFTRVNKHFGSVQSMAARIRSKSQIRSPPQWSSPRGGSPDGFDGHQVLTRRRSAINYRGDRLVRSPDRACFHTDTGFRRRKSPPYLDSRQEFVTATRSTLCNRRSPSGRVVQRNNSRFEILGPRERGDTDEYFESPVRSARFQDLGGGEGSGDERSGGAERRRPTRSFRVPEEEKFHFTEEDVPPTRPLYRFCPDENSEFSGRNNLRVREFERLGKNQPGPAHAPRRMRDSIEDQEGNYSGSGKVWHHDEFDDSVRVKRTRF